MRPLAVALVLSARLAHAHSECDDPACAGAVGAILAGTLVTAIHATLVIGLVSDNDAALRVGGWGTVLVAGLSALVALGFLFDTLLSRRDGLQVGGSAAWLATSVAVAGLGAYGVHRSTIVPQVIVAPVPGGASAGIALRW